MRDILLETASGYESRPETVIRSGVDQQVTPTGGVEPDSCSRYPEIDSMKAVISRRMVAESECMKDICGKIPVFAAVPASLLITGSSGTGKEVLARTIHELSGRPGKFVAINCGAVPENLIESELFGHVQGAYTDAKSARTGKFECADGGTLFLDEIGDITPALQVKLLRAIQERVIVPLGTNREKRVNVRIIAATNKNLNNLVAQGLFREDLFYRLNVLSVHIPMLRDRPEDIPALCRHFISRFNELYGKSIRGIDAAAMGRFMNYSFPGNIRELENIVEHCFVFCNEEVIGYEHLPRHLHAEPAPVRPERIADIKNLKDLEKAFLCEVLKKAEGNRRRASRMLGIHPTSLYRKMKSHGMD